MAGAGVWGYFAFIKPAKIVDPIVKEEMDSPLSPRQIFDQIDHALPYQQNEVAKSFSNAPVSWTLYLLAIDRDPIWKPDQLRVAMKSDDSIEAVEVFASVPITGNEKLSMLSRGAPLRVKGAIERADGIGISIKNGTIEVLPDSFRIKNTNSSSNVLSTVSLIVLIVSGACWLVLFINPLLNLYAKLVKKTP